MSTHASKVRAAVIFIVAVALSACETSETTPPATRPSPSPIAALDAIASVEIATPRPVASSIATPAASALPGCGAVEVGQISVCPGAGPVGTQIRIEGRSCADAGADVHLGLVGNPGETDGTVGSYSLPAVTPDASDRFAIEFAVPAVLDTVHGEGGGPTRPGTYRIISKPLYCGAKLTVVP